MITILCKLPIFATAKFSIEKPNNWGKMNREEKKDYFLQNMGCESSICCHCSRDIETDFEADINYIDSIPAKEFEFYEKN